jgi:plasmid rolling circle replication initiator protein Rep
MQKSDYLSDLDPQTRWDKNKHDADLVSLIYSRCSEFERYFHRINACGETLHFSWSGANKNQLTLKTAHFCHLRNCPVCQWRRSLMWQARFYQALPKLILSHPSARWVFLTLTVRNCEIDSLGDELKAMNMAFKRFTLRTEFKSVQGFVKTTEVTRGKNGTAHPHFHILMMVSSSFFTKNYVKHARWAEVWGECLKVDYLPNVDIRTLKTKAGEPVTNEKDSLGAAIAETLKYAVKPADMIKDPEWFLELNRQIHKKRFISSGGVLKDVLKVSEETDQDMIQEGAESIDKLVGDDGSQLAFDFSRDVKKYKRNPKKDFSKYIDRTS